ncbi:MAG: nucleotidyl transferase AbiEii/AbiGii toxin family protein, partial [Proteobacteria bacterium]
MLHFNTVSPLLREILEDLMRNELFASFRLVGGTALSLYHGHRKSVDIDLFSPAPYGSLDFKAFDKYLKSTHAYVDSTDTEIIGMGKSYFVGESQNEAIKLDLYYNDALTDAPEIYEGLRLATNDSIVAMKMDVIQRMGRKKDFYDVHELALNYSILEMIQLHDKFYPFSHDRKLLQSKLLDFSLADDDFEPDCLRGKH